MSTSNLEHLANTLGENSTPSSPGRTGGRRPPPPAPSTEQKPPAADTAQADAEQQEPQVSPSTTVDRRPENVATRSVGAASVAAEMGQRPKMGDLVQVRVQPPHVGEWFNSVIETGTFCFDSKQGPIAGAMILIAQRHWDEIVELLEAWGGEALATSQMRQMVWGTFKQQQDERLPRVVESDGD